MLFQDNDLRHNSNGTLALGVNWVWLFYRRVYIVYCGDRKVAKAGAKSVSLFMGGQPMCRARARSDPGTRASGGGVGRPNKWWRSRGLFWWNGTGGSIEKVTQTFCPGGPSVFWEALNLDSRSRKELIHPVPSARESRLANRVSLFSADWN